MCNKRVVAGLEQLICDQVSAVRVDGWRSVGLVFRAVTALLHVRGLTLKLCIWGY